MSGAVYPNLVPSYITIGQRGQELMIEYPIDLPKGVLLTVTFLFPNSDEEATGRAPTTSLGPRTVKVQLPAFQMYGIYTVIPKFPVNQEPRFPPFQLRVLSPVETLINVLAPEEDPYHATASQATVAVVAPLLAYLIQNEQQGVDEDSDIVDQVLAQIFPSMDRPIISLSEYLCGQYVHKGETLLHFCARHQFMKTCQILTEQLDNNALQQSLGMKGFDGKMPLDISEESENTNLSILLKTALTNKDNKQYSDKAKSKSQGLWKRHGAPKFDVIKSVMKKIEKKRTGSDETSDKASDQSSDLSQSLLKHLKDTALYCAEVVQSYSTVDKEFGSITLEVGDIAYITREEDKHWCMGIVNDRYCRFPIEFLRPMKQQEQAAYVGCTIPEPKDLLASGNSKVRDLEDMESLVTQRKKFIDYANEKETHSAIKRLSYPTPVTRSCSVETGLDEISNCSPLLRRNPLPIPAKALPKRPGITHREIPLPSTPTTEHDDDSSGDEYEPVDFGQAPSSPTLTSPVTRNHSITSNVPRMNQQSPLLKRRVLPSSTNDNKTSGPAVPDTKRPSVQSSNSVSMVPDTKRPSVQSLNSNRSSIISTRSEDEAVGYAKRDSIQTSFQSDNRVKQSSGTSIASSTHSERNMQIESPRKQSQISTTPQQSTTTSSSEVNDDSEDTDGEYDDVAALRLANTPVVDISSSDTKHSYVNVVIRKSPPAVQKKPKRNGSIGKSNNESQSLTQGASPTVRPKPVPPPKSMKPTINATPPQTPPLPSKTNTVASKSPSNATPPLPIKKTVTTVAPSVASKPSSVSKPMNPVQELAKRFEQN